MRLALPWILPLALAMALGACGDTKLRTMRSNDKGPEEFGIEPNKPLTQPDSYAALPPPVPGASNRADLTPRADTVAQLGGNPAVLSEAGPVPARDSAVVRHASRFGVPGDIRRTLAQEDAEFRRRQSRFTNIRLFRTDRYNQAYRGQALDPTAELRRFRRAGLPGPSAPPPTTRFAR